MVHIGEESRSLILSCEKLGCSPSDSCSKTEANHLDGVDIFQDCIRVLELPWHCTALLGNVRVHEMNGASKGLEPYDSLLREPWQP